MVKAVILPRAGEWLLPNDAENQHNDHY